MTLYSLIFLFFFLPVFMLTYRLCPAKFRRWVTAAANLCFIASGGVKGLAVYGVCLAAAYFSGREIHSKRLRPDGIVRCKVLLGANLLLEAAAFVLFAKGRGAGIAALDSFALTGGAVTALHFVSYLMDIYRGEEPADIGTLTAYSSFFPVMSVGPVLRYRRVKEYFVSPKLTLTRLSKGIQLYIFGLAEYLLITSRLTGIWREITSADVKLRGGAAAWLTVMIWYGAFISGLTAQLLMGQGIAAMMGLHIRKPYRRRPFDRSLYSRMSGVSVHLTLWIKDYIAGPVRRLTNKKMLAAAAGTLFGFVWMFFGLGGFAVGLVAGCTVALRMKFAQGLREPKMLPGAVLTRLTTAALTVGIALFSMMKSGIPALSVSVTEDSGLFGYLLAQSWLPLTASLVINGVWLTAAFSRMNTRWMKFIIPVLELIALVLCTAYLLGI